MGRSRAHFINKAKRNARNRMWGMQDKSLEHLSSPRFFERIGRSVSAEQVLIPDPSTYVRPSGEFVLDIKQTQQTTEKAQTVGAQGEADTVIDITEQEGQPQRDTPVLVGVSLELVTSYVALELSD